MKKITVALDDQIYMELVDYVAERGKRERGRLSISDSARELISKALRGSTEEGEVKS
jgi:metal-responsive CopG/Arc/MetJ family transcriptional regulator